MRVCLCVRVCVCACVCVCVRAYECVPIFNAAIRLCMLIFRYIRRKTLTFSAQNCLKMDLGLEIQKTNVGIRISILEIPCVPIFRQNGHL